MLATTHRDSVGVIGRLSTPLSPPAAALYAIHILGGLRSPAPITTLISGLGGYLLVGRNEEKRDQRAVAREDAWRRAARTEQLADLRHEIQRQTLSDLQDELQRLSRITFQTILNDQNTIREQGAPPLQIPEELDTGFPE